MAKIRCGIRENVKYLDGIWDLTASREAGFAKIWARDARFFGLSVGNSGNRRDDPRNVLVAKANQLGECKISIERANLHFKLISFCRNESFLMYFWGKNGIRDSYEKVRDAGFLWKRSGNAGSGPPLPDPV